MKHHPYFRNLLENIVDSTDAGSDGLAGAVTADGRNVVGGEDSKLRA